jgi:uncharacterized protein (TIGR02145 family)
MTEITTKIAGLEWTTNNLVVTRFANGDLIPHVESKKEWVDALESRSPAWCHYENNAENSSISGLLYNWFAAVDPRRLAPVGWRIPSDEDWRRMVNAVGPYELAGRLLKAQTSWESSSHQGIDSLGFRAVAGGYRNFYGDFFYLGRHAYFWSSTEHYDRLAWYHTLDFHTDGIMRYYNVKGNGFSCRLVREI